MGVSGLCPYGQVSHPLYSGVCALLPSILTSEGFWTFLFLEISSSLLPSIVFLQQLRLGLRKEPLLPLLGPHRSLE